MKSLGPMSSSPPTPRLPSALVGAVVGPSAAASVGVGVGAKEGADVAEVTTSSSSFTTPSPFVSPGRGRGRDEAGSTTARGGREGEREVR